MKQKQSYVTIVGRKLYIPLREFSRPFKVGFTDPVVEATYDEKNQRLIILGLKPGRGKVILENNEGNILFPVVVFREKESFLITALSSNYHHGWDPSLHDRSPHEECCGPDHFNNAFIHVPNMEKIIHGCGLPVTWFIDPPTAQENLEYFKEGMEAHNDEIAFMPTSYSHFNSVNYNLEKTLEETQELIQNGIHELEQICNCRVQSLAVDQFIGSIGTNFTRAAVNLGINALWGVGLDHFTCDTSMFHGGCPWNPYRPDRNNFRIPGKDPLPLWIFQWTFRDLINTVRVPGGASGAVMFSTDVDDILRTGITENQKDYYNRLVEEFLKNREHNDMLVVTVHQEDHDSWIPEGCEYYENFFMNLPDLLTPATIGEAAAWLNMKYPAPQEPVQKLRLEDSLRRRNLVSFTHPDIRKPDDWPENDQTYPPHIFYYDRDRQLVFEEGKCTPLRYLNYSADYNVPEDGVYPCEDLPEVVVNDIDFGDEGIKIELDSSANYTGYPLAIREDFAPLETGVSIPGGFVVFVDLKKGKNTVLVPRNYENESGNFG